MIRRRWPTFTLADLYRIWACTARVPVAPAGLVPVVDHNGTIR